MMPQSVDTVCIIGTDVFQKYNADTSVGNVNREGVTYTGFEDDY